MRARAVSSCVCAVLALAAVRARADEPPPPTPKIDEKDTVVVTGTRTPERAQRATVKTDVVTREEAERRGATNVAEALATQPGLVINPGSYGFLGGVSALQIQGFDRDRVLILEDGERVLGDIGGAVDLSAIPTADLDRIEIVTGPASALYGSAALGGVVNILTAPPRDFGGSGRARGEVRFRSPGRHEGQPHEDPSYYGVFGQGGAAYKWENRFEPWIGVEGSYTSTEGISAHKTEDITVGGVKFPRELPDLRIPATDRRMIGIRAGSRIDEKMDVRVRVRAFRDRNDGLQTQTAPGLGRYVIDTPEETDRYTLHVIHVTKLGGGSSLRLTMGRQWFDNFTAQDYRASPIFERHDRHQTMQSFEAVSTFADGPRTWVGGARFEAEHFEQDITRAASTSSGVVTTTEPEVAPLSYGSAAAYGQLSWKLGDVTVMPGVRVEDHTKYGGSVAPRLAAAWRINPVVTARASAGRGFRAPSAKELGFVFDHSIYGYKVLGNPNLQPETSWGVNGDVTVTPDPRMTFRGSAYANWVQDLIDLDIANGKIDGGVATYTYTNFGRARTAGAEVDATFKLAPFLRADASYAYTWTRDDVNDQPLPGRPPHAVTTALVVTPGWKLEMSARARVVTNSFLDVDTRAPGYQTVDARVGRALWPRSQMYAGVLNLTDVRQDPGRVGDTRPPLGRIVYIGLKADFPWEDE